MGRKPKETTWAGVFARLLADTGMTAADLSRASGMTYVGLWGLLHGTRKPNGETIRKLLAAAGKPWAWLDGVMEHPPKEPSRRP
jgi:transcriptional regulator with XRE-family HTH domain